MDDAEDAARDSMAAYGDAKAVQGAAGAIAGDAKAAKAAMKKKMDAQKAKLAEMRKELRKAGLRGLLDPYGMTSPPGVAYNPSQGPKTWAGAFFGLLSYGIVGALYYLYVSSFIDPNNFTKTLGEAVQLNYDCTDWSSIAAQAQGTPALMDVPPVQVQFDMAISFYEADNPSLQAIRVNDTLGYNDNYESLVTVVPEVLAAYESVDIPLNSWDDDFQQVPSPKTGAYLDLRETIALKTGHAFTDEPLKGMYEVEGILGAPSEFFAHSAHLYVRFRREQMAKIKSCQLQVQLFNTGIKDALLYGNVLSDRRYHNYINFPTLQTPDMTWRRRNFPLAKGSYTWKYALTKKQAEAMAATYGDDDGGTPTKAGVPGQSGQYEQFDMLYSHGSLTTEEYTAFKDSTSWGPLNLDIKNTIGNDVPIDKYLSWSVAMTYATNFVYTFEDYSCDGYEVEPFFGWAKAPTGLTGTEMLNLKFWDMEWESFEPIGACGMHKHTVECGSVQAMITSFYGQEIVTVVARDVLVCQDGSDCDGGNNAGTCNTWDAYKFCTDGKEKVPSGNTGAGTWTSSSGFDENGAGAYKQADGLKTKIKRGNEAHNPPINHKPPTTCDEYVSCDSTVTTKCTGKVGASDPAVDACSADAAVKARADLYAYYMELSWDLPVAYQNGAPTSWTCQNDWFEAWDGICDCNCGAWDPDCGSIWNPPQETRGCGENHYCSLAGTCLYEVDVIDIYWQGQDSSAEDTVLVSYDCGFLKSPGDNMVVGFVGSADNNTGTYHAGPAAKGVAGGDTAQCGSCPGDELFSFTAQKNSDGIYVCNILAEGGVVTGEYIDASDNDIPYNNHVDNPDPNGNGKIDLSKKSKEQTSKTASIQFEVQVGTATPFPVKALSDTKKVLYKVIVGAGDGNAEILNVTSCGPVDSKGRQLMTVSKVTGSGDKQKFKKPNFNHINQGTLAGAFTPASNHIYVLPGVQNFCSPAQMTDLNGDTVQVKNSDGETAACGSIPLTTDPSNDKTVCEAVTLSGYSSGCTDKNGDSGDPNNCAAGDSSTCTSIYAAGGDDDGFLACSWAPPPCAFTEDQQIQFDAKGPYQITVNDETAIVTAATQLKPKGSPFQKLTLGANNLENQIGMQGILQQDAAVGDSTVRVSSAGFGEGPIVTKMQNAATDGEISYAILSFGEQVVEVVMSDSTKSPWSCAADWYNDGEWCDCGCGVYDPDCRVPSKSNAVEGNADHPAQFHCESGSGTYCAYMMSGNGLCVDSQPADDDVYKADGLESNKVTADKSDGQMCVAASVKAADETADQDNIATSLLPRCSNAIHTEKVTLSKPLTVAFPALSILETSIYEFIDWDWCYDDSSCGEVVGFDPVSTSFTVRMYRPGRSQFLPKNRHKPSLTEATQSPESITADVALFLVPDRPKFADAKLCPKILTGSAATVPKAWALNGWDKWTINQGRNMEVTCEGITSAPVSSCNTVSDYKLMYKGQYRATCISDLMPPTHVFKYTVKKPINNIWTIPSASGLNRDDPMWYFEMAHRYTFAHDDMDDEAENLMAARGKSSGDYLPDQTTRQYTGAVNYRGLGTQASASQKVPANNPFLKATAIVNFADIAAEQIKTCRPLYYPGFDHKWYQKVMRFIYDKIMSKPLDLDAEIAKTLAKLEPLTINWDTSTVGGSNGQILLKPGYRYIMTADVGIYPIYRQTQYFGYTYIDGYGTALENVGISMEKLGYLEKTDGLVIFQIGIIDSLNQMIYQHNSSVNLLTAQFGAAIAYLGIGLAMLKVWQSIFCQKSKFAAWSHIKQAEASTATPPPPPPVSSPSVGSKAKATSGRAILPGEISRDNTVNRRPPTNV